MSRVDTNDGLRASVALCTYNGADHLADQLRSIAGQTRPPDEIVVCDDCSVDGSLEIVRDFAACIDFPVHIYRNSSNVGSTRNFERAIRKCSGDVVFLSDQDDVWHHSKIQSLLKLLKRSENTALVFSDAEIVDENLSSTGRHAFKSLGFTRQRQGRVLNGEAFETLVQRNFILGGSTAFRTNFVGMAYPFPTEWIHDAWIALVISTQAEFAFTHQPLTLYRQHSKQQLGLAKSVEDELERASRRGGEFRRREALAYAIARDRLTDVDPVRFARYAALLDDKAQHFERRARVAEEATPRRLWDVGRELATGRYFRLSSGWRSVAKDLFIQE